MLTQDLSVGRVLLLLPVLIDLKDNLLLLPSKEASLDQPWQLYHWVQDDECLLPYTVEFRLVVKPFT